MSRRGVLGLVILILAAVAALAVCLYPRHPVPPPVVAPQPPGGALIAGQVRDASTRSGIEGVEVKLLSATKGAGGKEAVLETGSAKTDAAGVYRFEALKSGSYRLYPNGRAAGRLPFAKGPIALELGDREQKAHVDFELEPGAFVQGLVHDREGKPIAQAKVAAIQLDWKGSLDEEIASLSAITGSDGRYRIAGLYPGKPYRVRAQAEGWVVSASAPITTPKNQTPVPADITMHHGSRVSGVAHYANGTPAGAYALDLSIASDQPQGELFAESKSVATDPEGRFTFERVPAGTYAINTPAGPARTGAAENAAPARVTCDGEQDVADISITVAGLPGAEQGAALSGVVVDAQDAPVAEAHVEARATQGGPDVVTATTDASGAFAMKGVTGQMYQVVVTAKDTCAFEAQAPADTKLTLRVAPRVRVTGVIMNDQNLPVANAKVRLEPEKEMAIGPELLAQLNPNAEQQCDSTGGFTFDVGGTGRYRVQASDGTGNAGVCEPFSVTCETPPPVVHVIIAQPSRFNAQIIDMRSMPVADASVELVPQGGPADTPPQSSAKTDASGMFTFEDIPQGLYVLRASHEGYGNAVVPNIRIVRGQSIANYRVILTAGGGIRGVFTAGNVPQEGATIQVRGDAVQRETKTDRDGAFLFQNLPVGTYTVAPAGMTQPTGSIQPIVPLTVSVTEGNITEASLGAAIGLPVMGVVGNAKPGYATLVRVIRPGAVVPLDLSTAVMQGNADAANSLVAQGVAGADGSFQLQGIAPGQYTIEVFALPFNAGNPSLSEIAEADRAPKLQQGIVVDNQQVILNLMLP